MEINNSDLRRWTKIAEVVCKDKEIASEILSQAVESIISKKRNIKNIDAYVFRTIRNKFFTYTKKEKKLKDVEMSYSINKSEEDESYIENDVHSKIKLIEEIMLKMDEYDQHLYILYFLRGMTYRSIAEVIQGNHMGVYNRINYIKNHIKDEFKKRQIEY